MHYFAYGSNMDEVDLKKWCETNKRSFPGWKLLGTACLENYQLSFNYYASVRRGGAANLMELSGHRVYGLLFEISDDKDLETIRKKEGCPDQYEEILVTVECEGRRIEDVTTFKVAKRNEQPRHQRPTAYYMDLILTNARKHGFPAEYIQSVDRIETQRSVRGG